MSSTDRHSDATTHALSTRLTRRMLLRAAWGAAATGATGLLLAACGGATATPTTAPAAASTAASSAPSAAAPSAAAASSPGASAAAASASARPSSAAAPSAGPTPTPLAVEGRIASGVAGIPDAYTKLPTPFKSVAAVPGKGSKVTTFNILYQPPIAPRGENKYWQELEKRLNVQIEATFASGNGGYQEKLPAVVASGDIPDLTFLWLDTPGAPSVNKAVEQGAFLDLTPYLSGNELKNYPNLAAFPPDIWQRSAFNKKIIGVPRPRLRAIGGLTFRSDWAKKAGTPEPKTTDEFYSLMEKFTKGDPDGNGRADTWGLGNQNTALFALNYAFFMHAVPNEWRKNADGTLTNRIETEQYKEAIAFCRKMYEAGLYHPDVLTMTVTQVNDFFASGKIGAYWQGIEGIPGPNGRRAQTKKLNPEAEVIGLVPPGNKGNKPVVYNFQGYYGHTSIPSRIKDPERVKELLRILDYYAAPFGSEEWVFLQYGVEGVQHEKKADGSRARNDVGTKEIGELTNLTYCLPPFYYDTPGDAEDMQKYQLAVQPYILENPVLGSYSPTAVNKAGEFAQLINDRQVAVVSGREPLSAIDQLVNDWRSRGGNDVRKEFEAALKA
jgi:putative aldouronate transport system substrate-binding protein